MALPVILTNLQLSEEDRRRLEEAAKGVVRSIAETDPVSYEDVEVLLMEKLGRWISREKIEGMPRLKFIQSAAAGLDDVDFSIIPEKVVVCGNAGGYAWAMAEYVFGAIFYLGKDFAKNDTNLRAGVFEHSIDGIYLHGGTIGVLGAGGVGSAVAKVAKAFGMQTMGVNTDGRLVSGFDSVVTLDKMHTVLEASDVVVLALPLTNKTRGLIDARALAAMKEGCTLVNVGRGKVVDEKALYDHLKAHPRFKAAIDVWWTYPKPGERFAQQYPFFDLPNFLGSPHVSGDVTGSIEEAVVMAIDNAVRFLRGEKPVGVARRSDYDWQSTREG